MEEQTTKRIVTIYDIAKEAGVSPSMVSRVISGKGAVSEEKRERIQQIIDECEYKPNVFARGLKKKRSGIIGFIIPHIGSEYFSTTYYEFERHAQEYGYMVAVYNGKSTLEVESQIFRRLEEARVEAIVIMGGRIDSAELEEKYVDEVRMLNQKIPCILCSERAKDFGCVGIHNNDEIGVELAVKYLKEKSYRTIGFLGGYPGSIPTVYKSRYLRKYAEKYGLEFRQEWQIGYSFNEQDGAESMKKLLNLREIPEVLFCINDNVAIGAMGVALDEGLSIPKDISFVGNDGIRLTEQIRPKLTTVAIDYETYGRKIFEAVEAAIEGKEEKKTVLIEPKLIVRSTTR